MNSLKFKSAIILLLLFRTFIWADSIDHAEFDTILNKFVKNGLVDYQELLDNQPLLNNYLNKISQMDRAEFEKLPREQKMVFWINAYNAITLQGILENYPIQYGGLVNRVRFPQNSIRQIGDFWNKYWIRPLGEEISLNKIEHEILRKKYKDPRIHFVLVCASIGCPDLENRAFFAQNLSDRLDAASQNFIRNPRKVKLDMDKNVLYLSSIFDWYKDDFVIKPDSGFDHKGFPNKYAGVVEFVANYLPQNESKFIETQKPELKFLDYDWTLNEQK